MLVLSRKINERILIGDGIEITVLKTSGGRVKLGIVAGDFVSVRRAEVCNEPSMRSEARNQPPEAQPQIPTGSKSL